MTKTNAEVADEMRAVLNFVNSWVANPPESYSMNGLRGLFQMTRDRIRAIDEKTGGRP